MDNSFSTWRSWHWRLGEQVPVGCLCISRRVTSISASRSRAPPHLGNPKYPPVQFSSVTQLCPTLRPHGPQHARPPCPSQSPGVYPNSCPSSLWGHPTISSSVVSFSSCPQSFPASGSFPMSQLFTSGGQSIGVSASTSVLPMNTQDWSPLGWTGWTSVPSKGLSRVFSSTTVQKHQFFKYIPQTLPNSPELPSREKGLPSVTWVPSCIWRRVTSVCRLPRWP